MSNSFPTRGYLIFNRLAKKHKVYIFHPKEYMRTLDNFDDLRLNKIPVDLPYIAGDKFTPRSRLSFYSLNLMPYIHKLIRIIRSYDIDVVVCSDPFVGATISSIAKSWDIINAFDYTDYMPAFVQKYLPHKLFIDRIGKSASIILEDYLIRNSDLIVTVGTLLVKYIKERAKNVIFIPNGTDSRLFHPNIEGENFREEYKIPEETFIFMFVGSLGFWVMLDVVLQSFMKIHKKYSETCFVVIGPDREYCIKKFGNLEKRGVYFIGGVPYRKVPECIAAADVCVLPFKLSLTTHAGIPVKMQEYAACGKPIVSTPLLDIKKFYGDAILYANDTSQFQRAFENYLKNEDLRKINGKKTYEIFRKNFDLDKLAAKYEEKLISLYSENH